MLAVHNTPFGDIVDTEDDLQPLVHVDVPRTPSGRPGWSRAALAEATFDVAGHGAGAPARAGSR